MFITPSPRRRRGSRYSAPDASPEVFGDKLKRDLAFKRIVAFENPIGGAVKRLFDFMIAFVSAPIWLGAIIAGLLSRTSKGRRLAIKRQECIGYGGRYFRLWSFQPKPQPSGGAEIVPINERSQTVLNAEQEEYTHGFFEALPGMINVLFGQMSLVGPKPLSRVEFDDLRGLRRYYASARPGLIDAYGGVNAAGARQSPYGSFSVRWTLSQDVVIADDAFQRMRARMKARRAAKLALRK